ncbi:MAG TPA: ATP-dependent helicase HrpB [Bdellovibrionales bacterium]|nr:ATP-dependent helicase HrpB [Bdellovibrionales bacterium]
MNVSLPIDKHLPAILSALEKNGALILQASPGSGKTTRVPPAVLKTLKPGRKAVVLEPRRLAAKAAASRVSEEWGEPLGRTIGYQFRFEDVTSADTRLRFLTEGMLIRQLISDPQLKSTDVVFLDEFHERHLHTDVALSYLRHLQKTARPDLKLVIMSATLDVGPLSRFLDEAPTIQIDAPNYEVKLEYRSEDKPLEVQVARAVRDALTSAPSDPNGRADILVFLPGMADIRRAQEGLSSLAQLQNLALLPLHGDLTREEQDRALKPLPQRKVILSTNVAETSVTIPGVTAVIDSGLARVASYSFWSGLPSLRTRPISRASATQRAGRAGRTCPGICIRLYARPDFEKRPAFDTPEIQRAELSQTLLELKTLGVERLEWFDPPNMQSEQSALVLLRRLGAVDKNQKLTALGRQMAEIPVHPRLSRLLLEAARTGCGPQAATAAALLSEGASKRLNILEELETRDPLVKRTRDRLLRFVKGSSGGKPEALAKSFLAGFPDRVAKLNESQLLLVLCDGGSATAEDPALRSLGEYFVCTEVQELQRGTHKRVIAESLVPIEPDWLIDLDSDLLGESHRMSWDEKREAVFDLSRLTYGQLVLSEGRGTPSDREAAALELATHASTEAGLKKICDYEQLQSLLERLEFLKAQGAPIGEFTLQEMAKRFALAVCGEKFALSELTKSDFLWFLQDQLGPDVRGKLDRWAPAFIQLPRGRRTRVNYPKTQPPWIESRLQDFFGMKSAPALMDGKVPLTLHLLAPNGRAVQVTTDLMSFWKNVYPKLRVELGRRYPRHKWPEDPLA